MNAHVTQMVELLFQNVQPSDEVQALHDEVMNNCQERYEDLVSHGISPEEAAAAVLESLKGMDEVLKEYPQKSDPAPGPVVAEKAEPAEEDTLFFSPAEIRALDFQVSGCDVRVEASGDGRVSMEKTGDVKMELADGTLRFRQESAVGSFFREFSLDTDLFSSFESFGEGIRKLAQTVSDGIRNTVVSQSSVTLRLPRDLCPAVSIRTTSGDVTWDRALPGDSFSVQTTSGNVEVETDGEVLLPVLRISSTSGDITCRVSAAEVSLRTISGDVDWRGDAGSLDISTTSGDADAVGSVNLTRMSTVSGDLTLQLDDGRDAEVEISTTSGDADVRVPRDTAEVRVRLDSVSGDLCLRGVQAVDTAAVRIKGHTVSGDLTVWR